MHRARDVKIRAPFVAGLAALAVLLSGGWASAAIVAHTAEPPAMAQRELANTVNGDVRVRLQNFRITEPTFLTEIEIHGAASIGATEVNLFLLDAVGPMAGPENILFSASQMIDSGIVGWWSFDLPGSAAEPESAIVLEPGVYNVAITSPQAFGFGWTLVNRAGSENVQFRATSVVPEGEPWHTSEFTFFTDPSEPVLGLRVHGEPAAVIPSPSGPLTLAGLGLALLARRRRA